MKPIEQQYKVLSDIDHILLRPGMYIGSVTNHDSTEPVFVNGKFEVRQITYVPALIKIFNEILDNAIDEHKRSGARLDTIKVDIDKNTGEIVIADNGGIPVVIHKEHNQYVPEVIFGNLRSGSNYSDEDDQSLIGTNGIGSKATSIMSTKFEVQTSDGSNSYHQEWINNMKKKSTPVIRPASRHYTKITFTPEYSRFGLNGLDETHLIKMHTAVVNAAGCNPNCTFYLNGEKLKFKSFEDYIKLHTGDDEYVFDESNDAWKVGVAASNDEGFQHVSFVNSVHTSDGGSHVEYVMMQITTGLRELIKKKHKVDVKPANIRQHLKVFISAEINRPKFDSQTKSRMISEPKDFKTSYTVPEIVLKRLMKTKILQTILDWVTLKEKAEELKALRELNKDADDKRTLRSITKLTDASLAGKDQDQCMVFLSEGDSAAAAIQSARTGELTKTVGCFPLRGKFINVSDATASDLKANKEFIALMAIMGIQIGEDVPTQQDGQWVLLEIDGKETLMNENDVIKIDGEWVKVKTLMK